MALDWFTQTGVPADNSDGDSSLVRAEFALIQAMTDKLPDLTGEGNKIIVVNPGGTALQGATSAELMTLLGGTTPSFAGITSAIEDAGLNSVTDVYTARHTVTGTPAVGIGVGADHIVETTFGNVTAMRTEAVSTDVGAGTEDFDYVIYLMRNGSLLEAFRVDSNGNLTLAGTVDGRDLATDGAKLDLIEALADVTDTANVTSAGALMDSEVDADLKTFVLPASTTITAYAQTFLDDISEAAVKATLNLEIGIDVQAYSSVLAATTASFLIADETKLDAIEALADVTDATNVATAGAVMESDTTTALMNFVIDEDGMGSNLDTKVPTQQSVVAYVTAQLATQNTLAEILVGGNTTGITDLIIDAGQKITADTIIETTVAAGVSIETVLLKDGLVDGRDVATDGSKLDGVELLADVTDTINVTAAGALMDSEVDADIKTLVLPATVTIGTYNAYLNNTTELGFKQSVNLELGVDVQAYSAVLAATTASFLTADETKLDAIEALADVTDTINVTSAGALMDSEVDANLKTLVLPATVTIGAYNGYLNVATELAFKQSVNLEIGVDVQAYSAVLGATTASFLTADETKLDAIEALADVTDATNVAASGAVMESDSTTALMGFVIDEDSFVSDLDTKVPTQQSVKAYVAAQVSGALIYQGGYNATTNTPDLDVSPSGISADDFYIVDTAGTFFAISYVGNGSTDLDFESTGKTVTRVGGSFITDLWEVGMTFAVTGSASNNSTFTINTVAALVLTVDEVVVTETNVAATITENSDNVNIGDQLIANQTTPTTKAHWDIIQPSLTAGQIKTQYESNADTNAFTDAFETKLTNIEALADVTDTANVTSSGALMDSEIDANLKTFVLPATVTIGSYNSYMNVATELAFQQAVNLEKGVDIQAYSAVLGATTASFLIADESKLDAIEALADVTDTINVTAAGALMDSEVDANIQTLVLPATVTIGAYNAYLNSATEAAFKIAVNLEIGVDVQAYSAVLGATTASFLTADETKLDAIEALADVTDETNVKAALDGATITAAIAAGTDKVLFQDTGSLDVLRYDTFDDIFGIFADGVYQPIDAVLTATTASFLIADETKLDNIEALADVTDVTNVTNAGALMDSEIDANLKTFVLPATVTIGSYNAYMNVISELAFQQAVNLEIGVDVQAYSAVLGATTASFLIADESKLDAIEALADVTDVTNVTAAGALMDSEVDADIKTLVLPASTTISTFGASLVDDASATAARATLGAVIGTNVQAYGAHLDDLSALTAVSATVDQFMVSTGAGTWGYETPATVRATLGLVIGTNVQAENAHLTDLAALGAVTATVDQFMVSTGAGTWGYETAATVKTTLGISAFGSSLIDDVAATNGRDTLELGSGDSPTFTGLTLSGTYKRSTTTGITAGATQTQVGATALTTEFNVVTIVATDGDGVKLPSAAVGMEILVFNDDAAQEIQIWPATGDDIDGGGANLVDATALAFGSMRKYIARDATNWDSMSLGGGAQVTYTRYNYTATASQTVFSATYTVGYLDVWINGAKLVPADITATNGTSITLAVGASLDDLVEIIAYSTFSVSSTLVTADIGATVMAYDATMLVDADIGGSVQAYDVDTAKLDVVQSFTAAQTFKEVGETQYSLTGTVIEPANGTMQYKTLSANTTFTESLVDGQSVTLMIDDGTAYTITWPTITWKTGGGVAPTLLLTGYTVITLWQVNAILYGALVGDA